jgi:hypothetical protein
MKQLIDFFLGSKENKVTSLGAMAVVGLVALLCYFTLPPPPAAQAQQVGIVPRVYAFNSTVLTICSNMTTNITFSACPVFRDRPLAVLFTGKSITNENTGLIVKWQVTTNYGGSSSTNWFTPYPEITTTFSNNSGILALAQYTMIPKLSVDCVAQVRPYSVQNTATTNNVTNAVFTACVTP